MTNPPLLPYVTLLASHLRRAKCIIRLDDVYPNVMVAAGLLKVNSVPYLVLEWLNRKLYDGAVRIIACGRDMGELVSRKMSRNQERIRVITNWADIELISPTSKKDNTLLKELGLTENFIIQWAGNMGHPHEVKSLFDTMMLLRDKPDIHFLFIGSGSKRAWLESQVKQNGLKNTTFLGNRPRSYQPDFLNACDIGLSSLVSGMKGISVPSRIYNILAAGKPILAIGELDSEIGLLVKEEKVGWIVPPGQPDQIVNIILEAYTKPTTLSEMGKRGRAVVERKYSSTSVIKRYIELIKELGFIPNV